MPRPSPIPLSLTGPSSHQLVREPGVGGLTLGPTGSKPTPDLLVALDEAIDWHVFDAMQTPAGSPWPRFIHYQGNDLSLFRWMEARPTERVTFAPRAPLVLDASTAKLTELAILVGKHPLTIVLPRGLRRFVMDGEPSQVVFRLAEGAEWPDVTLRAFHPDAIETVTGLPRLAGVQNLAIENPPMGTAFDCRSLAPLKGLRGLRLHGAVTHLETLATLALEVLELRFVPDLADLPALDTWPDLRYLIAWNVDEGGGRALQAQAKRRAREGGVFRVSKLRSRQWFIEEHGLPFAAWNDRNAKKASQAYKKARVALEGAVDTAAAKAVVEAFVFALNQLPGLETSEREDAGEAVTLLAATRPELLTEAEARAWFDGVREF